MIAGRRCCGSPRWEAGAWCSARWAGGRHRSRCCWPLEPVLRPLGNYNLLIFFVGVVAAMVFAGVPIAFSFGLATFGYLATHHPTRP